MSGEQTSLGLNLESVVAGWRERGRSTTPFLDDVEAKLGLVRHPLFVCSKDARGRMRVFDSAATWAAAVVEADRRAHPNLKAWAEICHASRVSVAPFMPWVANESESLDDLFRCELGVDDPPETPYCYVPEGWQEPNGKRTPVWLGNYVPRATDWRSLVAVEWSMRGQGTGNMPLEKSALALEMLRVLQVCAAFVVLDNGDSLVCRRPVELHFDAQGRLGRTDGPAVVWADGSREWYLWDQPIPARLHRQLNELYDSEGVRPNASGVAPEVMPTRQCEAMDALLRRELSDDPVFSSWFFDEKLRAGSYNVIDRDGPWRQEGQTVLGQTELRQVSLGGEERCFLVEQHDDAGRTHERVIEVPTTALTVKEALAWTFDPQDGR